MRRQAGFTLVEITIVVSIIALLAMIALPSFLRARRRTQATRLVNALRVATDAFEIYAMEHAGSYPAEANRAILPPEMATYFDPTSNWASRTPTGGNWDWDRNVFGVRAAVSVVEPGVDNAQMVEIDRMYDDGNLGSGRFQYRGGSRYTATIE